MYGLPTSTEVKKQLPKKAIYAKFNMPTSQREHFDAAIARLDIVGMVSSKTVPALAEGFPELDSFAAWDYIGDWFGVSGLDVMDEPTTEYPDLKLNLFLNGLGDLYLDGGKKEVVGWYVEEGTVFLARTVFYRKDRVE